MMQIVFLTDIHGKTDIAASIFDTEDPDYVFIGGDITDLGEPLDKVIPLMEDIPAPVFVVPGNCDKREILQVLEASDAVPVHKKCLDLGEITVAGIGGSNPTPFATPFEHPEEEAEEICNGLVSGMKKNRWNILISHAPPYGYLDEVAPDVHVGCHAVAKVLPEFDIICCGHIHEQKGIVHVGHRIIVNPGEARAGNYAVITINDDGDEPEVVLKNVFDDEED
ncbi:MAG TPA: metallophosphoesterase [Methanocorpusculum sp.]|nr:metallophosphoesterase [Methanocorpusculum sp.]